MKHLYVIFWLISSFIGTDLYSNELQDDDFAFSTKNCNEYFLPHFACENTQFFSNAFFDFDFEFLLCVNEKSLRPFVTGDIINIYSSSFTRQNVTSPLLYDLPPPDSMK